VRVLANVVKKKTKLIKAKVDPATKRAIERLAKARGESEAVVVREALKRYLVYIKRRSPAEPTGTTR